MIRGDLESESLPERGYDAMCSPVTSEERKWTRGKGIRSFLVNLENGPENNLKMADRKSTSI